MTLKKIYIILALTCMTVMATAQVQRDISVSDGDTVLVKFLMRPDKIGYETPLTLSIVFNEAANTMSFCMQSDKNVFGVQNGMRYNQLFSKRKLLKRAAMFQAEALPYEIEKDPDNQFKLSWYARREMGKGRKKRYIRKWIDSQDMTVRPSTAKMVSKSMTQSYNVDAATDSVKVSVRDIFVLDHMGSSPKKWKKYYFTQWQDMNFVLNIRIKRDPCINMDKEIQEATQMLATARERKNKLLAAFPENAPLAPKSYEAFISERDDILKKFFVKDTANVVCQTLRDLYTDYNACVDSIIAQKHELKVPEGGVMVSGIFGRKVLDANSLMFKARQLDELTWVWRMEERASERHSIKQQCEKIINDAEMQTEGKVAVTSEQKEALAIFLKAVQAYKKYVK